MVGSIRWNLGFGVFGFLFTFFLSNSNNIFITAVKHGLFSGFILFLLAFIFRWFIRFIFVPIPIETHVGNKFDLTIPDESAEIHQMMRAEDQKVVEEIDFKPLNPPKLVSKRSVSDPAELVKAIRHMSED